MTLLVQSVATEQATSLFDLPALDQLVVLCLRGLGRGPELAQFLEARFGPMVTTKVLERCDDLSQFISLNAHSPLERLVPGSTDLSPDELCFAHMCHLADMGEREELLIFATKLCRADLAPCLVPLAEMFVLSLKQALASGSIPQGCPHRGHTKT